MERIRLILEYLCRSYALNFGVRAIVLRLFSVYGPGLRKQLLWDLCSQLAANGRAQLGGTGDEQRDWLHVDDASRLIGLAIEHAAETCPIVNGGTGRGTAISDVARLVCGAWGGDCKFAFSGVSRPGDPKFLVAETGRSHAIGFVPAIPLERGIADYVRWFRSQSAS